MTLALWAILSLPASAQQQCGPRDGLVDALLKQYNEILIARAITSTNNLIEIFSTPDRSTWTLVLSNPNGISCLIDAGKDWQPVADQPKESY